MKCTACRNSDLKQVMTKQGVMIDFCPKCRGMWLDKGEIYYFTTKPGLLKAEIASALERSNPSVRTNPKTGGQLVELSLFSGKLVIDYSPETAGIWLDAGELEAVSQLTGSGMAINIDNKENKKMSQHAKETPAQAQMPKPQGLIPSIILPNLAFVSAMTLFSLYAILTAVLFALVYFKVIGAGVSLVIGLVFAFLQFVLSPFIMDITLGWFYKVQWTSAESLPAGVSRFLTETCAKENIKVPRIGIIPDGAPNAFTYGHTPNNARLVVTRGILTLLNEQEASAVVGHELGHIVHWDFLVMTIAYVVPLILYYIYRTLINIKSKGNDRSAGYRFMIAITSYVLYLVTEYVVLFFSRVREYFADRYSGMATKNPSSLASALIKIGYGLAGREQNKEEKRGSNPDTVKALGIFDPAAARSLAVSTYTPGEMGGEVDKESLKNAMKWDLWNPWAAYYEFSSTHPLVANRVLALSRQSQLMGKEPFVVFTEQKPESYWDEFFADLFMLYLPVISALVCVGAYYAMGSQMIYLKAAVSAFGLGYLFQVLFAYNSSFFPQMTISSLLKKIKVSAIRPVPCEVTGKLIGRGIPGLIWSEDFVLEDKTGIIYVDYNQPLAIWNFFFGLLRSGGYIGKEVTITGWYRRSPIPYLEIKQMRADGKDITCYAYYAKLVMAVLLIVFGAFFLLRPF
jgi:heat shock protein HtpX